MILNAKLSASDVFERLNVNLNEKFEIIGYENNPHQIIRKKGYFELVNCFEKVVSMNTLHSDMLQPYLVKKLNQKGENNMPTKFGDAITQFYFTGGFVKPNNYPKIERVIYNFKNPDKPATICFFDDGSKIVVRCDADDFTKEGGLAQCYLKKILGSRGNIQKIIENAEIQE